MSSRKDGSGDIAAVPDRNIQRDYRRRRLSLREQSSRVSLDDCFGNITQQKLVATDMSTALGEDDFDMTEDVDNQDSSSICLSSSSKFAGQTVAPFLAKHIPSQYAPLGPQETPPPSWAVNTRYCYRHRPDLKCRRQADEPSMEQLQKVGCHLRLFTVQTASHALRLQHSIYPYVSRPFRMMICLALMLLVVGVANELS
jgi:hypothetical protein